MSAQRLLDDYRSILKRIYAPDAYYERVRRFLERYHPTSRTRRSLSEYLAFCRSIVKQGMLGDSRASYWKFLIDAAVPSCLRRCGDLGNYGLPIAYTDGGSMPDRLAVVSVYAF
jgi:hypothetical protein